MRRTRVQRLAPLVVALGIAACERDGVAARDPAGRARLSFFALGDIGAEPVAFGRSLQTQMRVAGALADEHHRRAVDAVVLLGDNFYPDGLAERELEARVRENVVRPFCAFLALDGPAWTSVADACPADRRGDRPIPLYAVLGNHDFTLPESPRLQREVVPRYVPNWHVPLGPVEIVELADADLVPSVSLVLYDPHSLADEGDVATLERALREARGPWRVLAGHYPVNAAHPGPWIRRALEAIDVPVQLHLAGHEHNLQVGAVPGGDPPLQVVAGSASSMRAVRHPVEGGRFALVAPGFARVDLAGDGSGARLVVTLVALPVSNLAFWRGPRAVARWSVGLEGDVREEPLAAPEGGDPDE